MIGRRRRPAERGQFLNLTTLEWDAGLPADIQFEYAQLNGTWQAAYRACYGLYGVQHQDAWYAEIKAWNELVFYCSRHHYLHPDLAQTRQQILTEESLAAGQPMEAAADQQPVDSRPTRGWLARLCTRILNLKNLVHA